MCTAAFDELGVDGVYKVMKAERLSRKSEHWVSLKVWLKLI